MPRESVRKAIQAVHKGPSICDASRVHNVPFGNPRKWIVDERHQYLFDQLSETDRKREYHEIKNMEYGQLDYGRWEGNIFMPHKCCAPGCHSNYNETLKARIFSFPKDEKVKNQWLSVIPKTFVPSKSSRLCEKHFKPEDILTEVSAIDPKTKLTISAPLKVCRLKQGAVPSIFPDHASPARQRKRSVSKAVADILPKQNSEDPVVPGGHSMLVKSTKSMTSPKKVSTHLGQQTTCISSSKPLEQQKIKSPTTNHPIITKIKVEGMNTSDDDVEIEEVKFSSPLKSESSQSGSCSKFSLPSPYKDLPTVSVCLRKEDRVILSKELQNSVKRSASVGSNSSNGSNETSKAVTQVKRRKIEKSPPTVIGRQNDVFCWVCHREGTVLDCIACPRAYHLKCASESETSKDWVCPECQHVLAAENVDTRSSTLSDISLDKLCALLKCSLNKLKYRAPAAFHQPVPLDCYSSYLEYVIHPMDLSLIEKNIKEKLYGCTEAFLADVKWMLHNSCVFNGTHHPLSTNAKSLVKTCEYDMQEIEVCPDCFMHGCTRNKYWFSEICHKPHPLVWAKLKGFPYWPAKVVRILDGNVDARFFGAHDRAWVPISQCYHLSKEMPTSSKPKKKGTYDTALDELNVHVHLLIQKFGTFEYAPYRTNFNTENKLILYHGIDVEKISKEDVSFEPNMQQSEEIPEQFSEPSVRVQRTTSVESEKSEPSLAKVDSEPSKSPEKSSEVEDDVTKGLLLSDRLKEHLASVVIEKKLAATESEDMDNKEVPEETSPKTKSPPDETSSSSNSISDAEQLKKLELALERIKGYISKAPDVEKTQTEKLDDSSSPVSTEKVVSTEDRVDADLPDGQPIEESSAKESVLCAPSRKDSFFMKLNETIESCKAKLGISEFVEEHESSGSESVEDEEEEDVENESENSSLEEEEEMDESASSSENEESNSEASDTDVEDAPKKTALDAVEDGKKVGEIDGAKKGEDSATEVQSKEDCVTEDPPTSKKTEDDIDSSKMNVSDFIDGIDSDSEGKRDGDLNIESTDKPSSDFDSDDNSVSSTDLANDKENAVDIDTEAEKLVNNNDSEIRDDGDIGTSKLSDCESDMEVDTETVAETNSAKETLQKSITPEMGADDGQDKNCEEPEIYDTVPSPQLGVDKEDSVNFSDLPEQMSDFQKDMDSNVDEKIGICDDDDSCDIYICDRPKKPEPPLICLDDGTETETDTDDKISLLKCKSDDTGSKTSPIKPTIESVDQRVPLSPRLNDMVKPPPLSPINSNVSRPTLAIPDLGNLPPPINAGHKRRARAQFSKFCSEDLLEFSDDEVQTISCVTNNPLSGAKRTFHSLSSNSASVKLVNPLNNAPKVHNPETDDKFSLSNYLNKDTESNSVGPNSALNNRQETNSINLGESIDSEDPENEITRLKRKVNILSTALQRQHWRHLQEKTELRHNMNLIIMEMRTSLEADKKHAIEVLSKQKEREKAKYIEETKKKQWCASCRMESRYACCWNTSYCTPTCQKRHFPNHMKFCGQLAQQKPPPAIEFTKVSTVVSSASTEVTDKPIEKKIIVVNMKPSDTSVTSTPSSSPIVSTSSTEKNTAMSSILQIKPKAPQIQIITTKSPLQVVSPSTTTNLQLVQNPKVQFVYTTGKNTMEQQASPSLTAAKVETMGSLADSADIIHCVRKRMCDLGTAISLLKMKNDQSAACMKKDEQKPDETNLEEIYFPMPNVQVEGYESNSAEGEKTTSEAEVEEDEFSDLDMDEETDEKAEDSTAEEEPMVLSEEDEANSEKVSIGHGIEINAKLLNKCLIFGQTPKKLTRCLVDVLIPDIKLLASCSAFGQKSNVTKLTRAALPAKKVHAIIDFVQKRYPQTLKSVITLAINMKCKEARKVLGRRKDPDSPQTKKPLIKRLLQKDKEESEKEAKQKRTSILKASKIPPSEIKIVTKSPDSIPVTRTTVKTPPKTVLVTSPVTIGTIIKSPKSVCVTSSSTSDSTTVTKPTDCTKAQLIAIPKILRYQSRMTIKPNPSKPTTSEDTALNTKGPTTLVVTAGGLKKMDKSSLLKTVLPLSNNLKQVSSADSAQIVMPVRMVSSSTAQSTSSSKQAVVPQLAQRPIIILGSNLSTNQTQSINIQQQAQTAVGVKKEKECTKT